MKQFPVVLTKLVIVPKILFSSANWNVLRVVIKRNKREVGGCHNLCSKFTGGRFTAAFSRGKPDVIEP